jgi:hypothetical protein
MACLPAPTGESAAEENEGIPQATEINNTNRDCFVMMECLTKGEEMIFVGREFVRTDSIVFLGNIPCCPWVKHVVTHNNGLTVTLWKP